MLLAIYTIGHCLGAKDKAGKWEKVNSAEYHGMLTRGAATTCIAFRASERQPEVRRLIASAVVDSCLYYIVESCILRTRLSMSSNSSYFCNSYPTECDLSVL